LRVPEPVAAEHSRVHTGSWKSGFGANLIIELLSKTLPGLLFPAISGIGLAESKRRRGALEEVNFFTFFLNKC